MRFKMTTGSRVPVNANSQIYICYLFNLKERANLIQLLTFLNVRFVFSHVIVFCIGE